MQRVAFQMHLKEGAEQAYDEAHRKVWPEVLAGLQANGVREYSIFRRERELFCYMLVPDIHKLMNALAHSEVDRQWQQMMAPLMEPYEALTPGEPLAFMNEVFYMQGEATCEPTQETAAHAE